MAVLIVTYDLNSPGQDYSDLYDALRTYEHCHGVESVWLLDTTSSCAEVRNDLKQKIDKNDTLFVARLAQKDWASRGYDCASWLKADERNW